MIQRVQRLVLYAHEDIVPDRTEVKKRGRGRGGGGGGGGRHEVELSTMPLM